MASYVVYLLAAGLMAVGAAFPFAEAHGYGLLGLLAGAWVAGAFLVPVTASELLGDHYRTALVFLGMCSVLALFVPWFALLVLVALLLVIRNRDFFPMLTLMSLFVLLCGLSEKPSYAAPALVVVCMVAAAYARAARRMRVQHVGIAVMIVWASLCAGGLLAFLAPFGLPLSLPPAERARPAPPDDSRLPLYGAVVLLPVAGFLLVKYLHLMNRSPRGAKSDRDRAEGRLEKDEALAEETAGGFAGSRTNAAVVKGYVKWRAQLASYGVKFTREDTAEEGATPLEHRLAAGGAASVRRITELFNLARYGDDELPEAAAAEFAALTRSLVKEFARPRR